jgi:hypothetical protein
MAYIIARWNWSESMHHCQPKSQELPKIHSQSSQFNGTGKACSCRVTNGGISSPYRATIAEVLGQDCQLSSTTPTTGKPG